MWRAKPADGRGRISAKYKNLVILFRFHLNLQTGGEEEVLLLTTRSLEVEQVVPGVDPVQLQ